jgi:ribose transport system permease protein
VVGAVIAGLIARARIPSLITTLAISFILVAMTDWISGSQQILDLGTSFQRIATDELLGFRANAGGACHALAGTVGGSGLR